MFDFNIQLAVDAAGVFLQEFSEQITYTPHGDVSKTIKAVIDRSPVRILEHGGRQFSQKVIELWIINNATNGVSSVKPGFDTVAFKVRLSDECDTTVRVVTVLESDRGMWHLEAHV